MQQKKKARGGAGKKLLFYVYSFNVGKKGGGDLVMAACAVSKEAMVVMVCIIYNHGNSLLPFAICTRMNDKARFYFFSPCECLSGIKKPFTLGAA